MKANRLAKQTVLIAPYRMIIGVIHVNNRSVDNYNHHYCTVLAETQVANMVQELECTWTSLR